MAKRTGTNNDIQNIAHGQKNRYKQCSTKHYTWPKEQIRTMIYKTLHMVKRSGTNNDLQNTTHGQQNRYKQ